MTNFRFLLEMRILTGNCKFLLVIGFFVLFSSWSDIVQNEPVYDVVVLWRIQVLLDVAGKCGQE